MATRSLLSRVLSVGGPLSGLPIWLDESGSFQFRIEQLKLVGWRLFTVTSYANWCGHGQEFIPVPDDDGWCQMIPVPGEAT